MDQRSDDEGVVPKPKVDQGSTGKISTDKTSTDAPGAAGPNAPAAPESDEGTTDHGNRKGGYGAG